MSFNTKKCTRCNFIKPLSEFYKNSGAKCKLCKKTYEKRYLTKNKKKVAKKSRVYRKSNKEKIAKDKKQWSLLNKEHVSEQQHEWYVDNKDQKLIYEKEYKSKNKELIRNRMNKHRKERLKIDKLYALTVAIRRLIGMSLKHQGYSKKSRTYQYLQCTFEDLMKHLEKTFITNYGRLPTIQDNIHIDHIKPCSSASSEEDLIKLQHFSNLQWLLAKDNLRKGDNHEWTLN
jgi:hypothetical protein